MSQRTKLLVGGLVAVVLVWVLMSIGDGGGGAAPSVGSAGARPGAPARRGAGGDADGEGGARQVLALAPTVLEEPRGELEPGRNPFRFYQPPAPRPTPPPRRVEPPPRREPVVQQQPVRTEPPRPQPPPVTYRYLGSFGSESRKIAVFSDGETIVNARVGDVLDGKFRVARIGYESADLAFVDFPDVPPERLPVGQ